MTEDELFERGLQVRREVLGAEYVDATSKTRSPSRWPDLSVSSIVWIALLLVAFDIGIGFVAAPRSSQSQPRAEGSLRG